MASDRAPTPLWGLQIKPKPQPLRPLFEQVVSEGYGLVEWRSPTVRGTTQPEWDLVADPESAKEIRELAEEYGMKMAYHAPQGAEWDFGRLAPDEAVSRLEVSIRRAASIGAETMTLHLGIVEGEKRAEAIRAGARAVVAAADLAKREGVLLCVENVFDDISVATVEDCEMMFEELDGAAMLTLDTGHGHLCGTLYELVERFGDRIAFAHIHDNDGTADQHRIPGNGTLDWERLMSLLDAVGYTGPINFELREVATLEELKARVLF